MKLHRNVVYQAAYSANQTTCHGFTVLAVGARLLPDVTLLQNGFRFRAAILPSWTLFSEHTWRLHMGALVPFECQRTTFHYGRVKIAWAAVVGQASRCFSPPHLYPAG